MVVLLWSCKDHGGTAIYDVVIDSGTVMGPPPPPKLRSSVTFIMGNDNSGFNQYYTLASHYYRSPGDDHTDIVIDHLSSLSQVLDWLRLNPAPDSLPYGLVNIVSHGNEFIDLQMKVTPRGERTSPASLQKALDESLLSPPDSSVIDSRTLIFLHGCAVGQNQPLLDALALAFGGNAKVMASKLFEYYAYLSSNKNPQSIRHYYARTWYAFQHPDSSFDEKVILKQLRSRYPSDTTHWREGLRRRFQDNPTQIYHYSFVVPCSYSEFYDTPTDMPSVNTKQKRRQWIENHEDFKELLSLTHIPMNYFQVKFYRQTMVSDDNHIYYGLRVKARSLVICLIQPITVFDTTLGIPFAPFRPSISDSSIFAFSK